VRLVGLVETPHLNGRVGTCVELSEGHWTVALDGDDDEIVMVHERNMEIVIPPLPAIARAAHPPPPPFGQPVCVHIQAQDETVPLGASGSRARNTSVVNCIPSEAIEHTLPRERPTALPSNSTHESQVEVPFRKSSCCSGRMVLACGVVVAVLTATIIFYLAVMLDIGGDNSAPTSSPSVSASPTVPNSFPPFVFIHPCTGEMLNSTTITRLHIGSMCAGTIPTQLGQLTALTYLDFWGASCLTGTIPTQLGQLTALKRLYFDQASSLTGTIPTQLGRLTALTSLSFIYASSLTSTIPTQLGQLTALTHLSFSRASSLMGTIPTELGQLTALGDLCLGASSLTGSIPTHLGQLTALTYLSFYRASSLTGTIPTQLGQSTALTRLDFYYARSLTGTIPTQLGQLTALNYLSFYNASSLTGTIPSHLGQLMALTYCNDKNGASFCT